VLLSPRPSRSTLARLALLAGLIALIAHAAPAAGAATDPRPFPRTYHVYSGWTDPNVLGRYDMVVGFANWNVAKLRAVNPGGIFLLQPGLAPASGTDYQAVHITSGAISRWRGGTDRLPGGVDLGYIRPFDTSWDWLYNADGSRAGSYPTWNYADPKGKGTPELVAKVISYASKLSGVYSKGWDGIHTDEWIWTFVGNYGTRLDADRNRVIDDQTATHRAWQEGMAKASRLIAGYLPGKTVGGNGVWWRMPDRWLGTDRDAWRSSTNYTLFEHWDRHFYSSPQAAIDKTRLFLDHPDPHGRPRYAAAMQSALRCDGTRLELPQGVNPNQNAYMLDACTMRSMRWGLTLALMAGVYYEIYGWPYHGSRWWYDEYDGGEGVRKRGYLGQPLDGPVRLPNGVYRRDFENGVALNNSSSESQTVELGPAFRKLRGTQNPALNNGQLVTSVTIPAHDGLILLRTQAPSPPPPSADTTAPAAPAGLVATAGETGIALQWDDSSEGDLAGYRVYRAGSTAGPFTLLHLGVLTASTYLDGGAAPGVPSHYRLTAVDTSGNESAATAATSTRPTAPETPGQGDVYDRFVTDPGCGGCVATMVGGELRATIAGGADSVDTAYGWRDTGERTGRVYTRDVLRLANGQALGGDLILHQVLDGRGAIVYQLSLNAGRQLVLYSPAGGLRASAISTILGVTVPADGRSVRIEVSALRNSSVAVRVDGADVYALTGLAGATGTSPRFLRVGIIRYGTTSPTEPVTVYHRAVDIASSDWLGAP
jgi:hypothetical protein